MRCSSILDVLLVVHWFTNRMYVIRKHIEVIKMIKIEYKTIIKGNTNLLMSNIHYISIVYLHINSVK